MRSTINAVDKKHNRKLHHYLISIRSVIILIGNNLHSVNLLDASLFGGKELGDGHLLRPSLCCFCFGHLARAQVAVTVTL